MQQVEPINLNNPVFPPRDSSIDGEFLVNLEFFSGPMDLLLHLVEQQEVEIEQVDLTAVCEQYLKIVEQSAELDLDRAGEFLVVAATLVARKSEALLPSGNPEEITADEDGYDPRFFSELRERLIAYRETKRRADLLISHPQLGIQEFATKRSFVDPEVDAVEHEEIGGEPMELGFYFYGLLKRIGEAGRVFKVKLESITVIKYMVGMLDRLSEFSLAGRGTKQRFFDLVSSIDDTASNRGKLTGSFIATLELVKRGAIKVSGAEGNFEIEVCNTEFGGTEIGGTEIGGTVGRSPLAPSEFDEEHYEQKQANS